MVKCIVLGEKENHPYLMILFVCLILLFSWVPSPLNQHSTGTTSNVKCIFHGAICEILFMWTNSAFYRCSPWTHHFPPRIFALLQNNHAGILWTWEKGKLINVACMGQFLQHVLQGFRKVMSAKSERPRIRGWEHGGSWWSSGPEGQRFIPLSMTRVHCNSIKYSGEKTQRSFRLQRSHALIPAKWCHVPRLWSSLAPLCSGGCLIGPAANCSKMKVPR